MPMVGDSRNPHQGTSLLTAQCKPKHFWFKLKIVPQQMPLMNIAATYLYCANLMTNNPRICLVPICYCLLFSMQKFIGSPSRRQGGKILISHVSEQRASDTWSTSEAFAISILIAQLVSLQRKPDCCLLGWAGKSLALCSTGDACHWTCWLKKCSCENFALQKQVITELLFPCWFENHYASSLSFSAGF